MHKQEDGSRLNNNFEACIKCASLIPKILLMYINLEIRESGDEDKNVRT